MNRSSTGSVVPVVSSLLINPGVLPVTMPEFPVAQVIRWWKVYFGDETAVLQPRMQPGLE